MLKNWLELPVSEVVALARATLQSDHQSDEGLRLIQPSVRTPARRSRWRRPWDSSASTKPASRAAVAFLTSLGYEDGPIVVPLARGRNFIGRPGGHAHVPESLDFLAECRVFEWPESNFMIEGSQWFIRCDPPKASVCNSWSTNRSLLLREGDPSFPDELPLRSRLAEVHPSFRRGHSHGVRLGYRGETDVVAEGSSQLVWESLGEGDVLVNHRDCFVFAWMALE